MKKSVEMFMDESLLGRSGHKECMADDRLVEKINNGTVEGARRRSRL